MFTKILVANRGEIACRVMKTARRMGIATVAVYSDADRNALHRAMADESVYIGPSAAADSYLVADKIIAACRETGAQAVHPGYGFLSERASFCTALEAKGIVFIGPKPRAIEAMGDKITSKKLAAEAGVSTVPGFMGLIDDADHAVKVARDVGFPVMIKATAGGGGKGMRIAWDEDEAREGYDRARSEAAASFGDDRVFVEKFIEEPRHIEIQVLADSHGKCIYLGERECSIQRRNQKVVEEAPSPFLDEPTRAAMGAQAVALAQACDYQSAGTVEFIVDKHRTFYFLEMNTRLQVEHPVTELITGIDLVEQMIRVAAGEKLAFGQDDIHLDGWAVESRVYAEDPLRGFLPSTGRLTRYRPPGGTLPPEGVEAPGVIVRNDSGVIEGSDVSRFSDPMIAKLCTWANTRGGAIDAMADALDAFEIDGVGHNIPFLAALMQHPRWRAGTLSTAFIAEEYPDGFAPAVPDDADMVVLAVTAAALAAIVARRQGAALSDKVVAIGDRQMPAAVAATKPDNEFAVTLDGQTHPTAVDWTPGRRLARVSVNGLAATVTVLPLAGGFRLRWRGMDVNAQVLAPRVARLMALMPVKAPPDTSNLVLCPMPGLVVAVHVAAGDSVVEGQQVAIIEAMKMENVLRADRAATVLKVPVKPGDSLAADDVIIEFAS